MPYAFDADDNAKKNQMVKSSTVGAFIALVLACGLLFGPLLQNSEEQVRIKSLAVAQSVGYQAWELERRREQSQTATSSAGRSPSSIQPTDFNQPVTGSLGQDPWGQPFSYKIRSEGQQKVIDVWSEGVHGVRTQVLIPISSR